MLHFLTIKTVFFYFHPGMLTRGGGVSGTKMFYNAKNTSGPANHRKVTSWITVKEHVHLTSHATAREHVKNCAKMTSLATARDLWLCFKR